MAEFVAPQFVTPRHSDEGNVDPHSILPRDLLLSPSIDRTTQRPPPEAAAAAHSVWVSSELVTWAFALAHS